MIPKTSQAIGSEAVHISLVHYETRLAGLKVSGKYVFNELNTTKKYV